MSQLESDARPLTQQEYELTQRLLSDPFAFPLAYKTWLVSYMETSDLSLPIASILGLRKALNEAVVAFQVGMVMLSARTTPPPGALLCDGGTHAKADYPALWAAIGSTWGEPTPETFNVPSLAGPTPGVRYIIVS